MWIITCLCDCVVVDDRDEEATISEQEQMEDDNENVDEVQQLSKEGMHACTL